MRQMVLTWIKGISRKSWLFICVLIEKYRCMGERTYMYVFPSSVCLEDLSSVQFSRSVVSDSLRRHELQHTRPPCPSPTPGVHPNPCPLSWRCHPTISSSVILLPSIFPSVRVFSNGSALRMRWPKYWSFSFNISPSNEHPGLISLGWAGWISLQSKGLSRVFSNTTVQKHQFFCAELSL